MLQIINIYSPYSQIKSWSAACLTLVEDIRICWLRLVEVFVSVVGALCVDSDSDVSFQNSSCFHVTVFLSLLISSAWKFVAVKTFQTHRTFIGAAARPVGSALQRDLTVFVLKSLRAGEGVKTSHYGQRCQKNTTKVVLLSWEKQQTMLLFPAEQQKDDRKQMSRRKRGRIGKWKICLHLCDGPQVSICTFKWRKNSSIVNVCRFMTEGLKVYRCEWIKHTEEHTADLLLESYQLIFRLYLTLSVPNFNL